MAKLVSKLQTIVLGVTMPVPQYSRVVSCWVVTAPGPVSFPTYTVTLGSRLYLRKINVWCALEPGGATERVHFRVKHGAGEPQVVAEMESWDDVVPPLSFGGFECWRFWGNIWSYEWTMNQVFAKSAQRFGLQVVDLSTETAVVTGSFEISEF